MQMQGIKADVHRRVAGKKSALQITIVKKKLSSQVSDWNWFWMVKNWKWT